MIHPLWIVATPVIFSGLYLVAVDFTRRWCSEFSRNCHTVVIPDRLILVSWSIWTKTGTTIREEGYLHFFTYFSVKFKMFFFMLSSFEQKLFISIFPILFSSNVPVVMHVWEWSGVHLCYSFSSKGRRNITKQLFKYTIISIDCLVNLVSFSYIFMFISNLSHAK